MISRLVRRQKPLLLRIIRPNCYRFGAGPDGSSVHSGGADREIV